MNKWGVACLRPVQFPKRPIVLDGIDLVERPGLRPIDVQKGAVMAPGLIGVEAVWIR